MYNIKTYNNISNKGLDRLSDDYQVSADIDQPDAIVLRSHKLKNEVVPNSVLAIARAGAGYNNIDVESATKQGIVVFNTPGANANAVRELVFAAILMAARNMVKGTHFAKQIKVDDAENFASLIEAQKKALVGNEIVGKTLGIIGLGHIGSLVANTGISFGMKVIGYDPVMSVQAAWRLSNHVTPADNIEQVIKSSDYVSLHIPYTESTHHLIDAKMLSYIPDNAVLLNFARGGIVDDAAAIEALNQGKLKYYVTDFPVLEHLNHEGIITTPHLGASTYEAEENCAVMAVDQIKQYLEDGNIKNSVNLPDTYMARVHDRQRFCFANTNVPKVLSGVLNILADYQVNVHDMVNRSQGDVAYNIIDVDGLPDQALDRISTLEEVIFTRTF